MGSSTMDFGDFYRLHHDGVLRLCWLSTLDRGDAADAAQEAFTRAWKHWPQIADTDPAAWTRTVALNLCRNRWRRIGRQTLAPEVPDQPSHVAPGDMDLLAALRALSRRQREAVLLYYWLDLDIAGCAMTMGVSAGSVKQHLSRARTHLTAVLDLPEEVAP